MALVVVAAVHAVAGTAARVLATVVGCAAVVVVAVGLAICTFVVPAAVAAATALAGCRGLGRAIWA